MTKVIQLFSPAQILTSSIWRCRSSVQATYDPHNWWELKGCIAWEDNWVIRLWCSVFLDLFRIKVGFSYHHFCRAVSFYLINLGSLCFFFPLRNPASLLDPSVPGWIDFGHSSIHPCFQITSASSTSEFTKKLGNASVKSLHFQWFSTNGLPICRRNQRNQTSTIRDNRLDTWNACLDG